VGLAAGTAIGDGAINTVALADSSISTAKLQDASVTSSKLDSATFVDLPIWWEELGRTTLTAPATDAVVSLTGKQRKFYKIMFKASGTATGGIGIRVNGLNSNTSYNRTLVSAGTSVSSAQNQWQLGVSTNSVAAGTKIDGSVEMDDTGYMWGTTMGSNLLRYGCADVVGNPTVTSISVGHDTGTLATGSQIIVLGHN